MNGLHLSSYFQVSAPYNIPSGIVTSMAITTGITVTFAIHCFLISLARSTYLSLFLLSFSFTLWSTRVEKFTIRHYLVGVTITRYGRLDEISWSICISKSQKTLCTHKILQDGLRIVHIPLLRIVKPKLLEQFPVDVFPHIIMSSLLLILHSFPAYLCCWSFRLYHHITFICYLIESGLFYLELSWS